MYFIFKYQNADITKKHVMKVLNLYKGLKYNVEPFGKCKKCIFFKKECIYFQLYNNI